MAELTPLERLQPALLDRLTHHVHILEMNGDSYRLKQSKTKRRKGARPGEASPPDTTAATEAIDPATGEITSTQ